MILTVVATLAGTVLGIVGTLLAQRESTRAENVRFTSAQTARRRDELRKAIDGLLRSTQRAEQAADDHGENAPSKSDASHSMWISHKQLTLICSNELKTAADEYCDELNLSLHQPEDEPAWSRTLDSSRRFRDVARSEIKEPVT